MMIFCLLYSCHHTWSLVAKAAMYEETLRLPLRTMAKASRFTCMAQHGDARRCKDALDKNRGPVIKNQILYS